MTEETHHVNLVWQPPSGHEQKPSSLEFAAPSKTEKNVRKRHVEFLINTIVTLAIDYSRNEGVVILIIFEIRGKLSNWPMKTMVKTEDYH
jgi:hypothetical protein